MTEVTEGDRQKAVAVTGCILDDLTDYPFCSAHDDDGNPPWHRCRWAPVAAALAEEREKARAPFLALADEFDQRRAVYANAAAGSHDDGISKAYWVAADRIRRAAEGEFE